MCGKKYATHNAIVRHQRSHKMTREKSFICDICGKKCRDKKAIEFHLFQKHVTSEPKFECKICQKKFPLQSLLYSHMYGVHREKKASVCCEICGKSFYTNFHLNKHMLTHSDKSERLAERKQCEHCGEWLMTYSGIYYHKQVKKIFCINSIEAFLCYLLNLSFMLNFILSASFQRKSKV